MDRDTLDKILAAHSGHRWGRLVPWIIAVQGLYDVITVLRHGF